jgi:phage shock protein E
MFKQLPFAAACLLIATPALAQEAGELRADGANPLIDYAGFDRLVTETAPLRAKRLVSLDGFRRMADRSTRVLVLDARSREAFAEGHMAGAVNLPFPDFTAESLAELIGSDRNRPVLIYCNNNFTDNRRPVMTKKLELALNIQTFVNLTGYGYRNVWELGEAVATADPRVRWMVSPG